MEALLEKERLSPSEVFIHYHHGYTVILNHLQDRWPPLRVLCRDFEEDLNASTPFLIKGPFNSNLYLTPRNAQAASPHYDDHDVFVLQLEGSKNWTLYNQLVRFPMEALADLPREELGSPLHTVHLSAGDLLYIPRGYPHEAATSEDYSMHLTINFETYTWADAISTMIHLDDRFRSSLPFNSTKLAPTASPLKEHLEELVRLLCDEENWKGVLKQLIHAHVTILSPLASDYLDQINQLGNVSLGAVVCKRYGRAYQITREEKRVTIHFPGYVVHYPPSMEAVFRFILESDDFAVGSIPGFSRDDQKLTLVRRLIGYGFLKTVRQPG
jgi:hypothetical protein